MAGWAYIGSYAQNHHITALLLVIRIFASRLRNNKQRIAAGRSRDHVSVMCADVSMDGFIPMHACALG